MCVRCLLGLAVQIRYPLQQVRSRCALTSTVARSFPLQHRSIPNGRHGLAVALHALLGEFLMPAPALTEERPRLRWRNLL